MEQEIIKVNEKNMRFTPNLSNYAQMYRTFSWKDAWEGIEIFKDKKMNAAHDAIDRHTLTGNRDKIALHWISSEDKEEEYSFRDMQELSNKFANVLQKIGVKKGDRCFTFLPRIPEQYISFIGILKAGAIAGTMFSAFGPEGIKDRLLDSEAVVLVTDSELLQRVYAIAADLPALKYVIVVNRKRTAAASKGKAHFREISYEQEMGKASDKFKIVHMKPTDYAFMLYTSGTTGKPKGIVHAHQALIHEHITAKYILDLKPDDIYWCTADPGWVTGIAYGILGSWSNGASSVVYEGKFDAGKWYEIIQKKKVTVWYTAPTAIRLLAAEGDLYKKYNLKSLRHLCSVGEPLNPEPLRWSLKAFKMPFHDTWWQTETGGIMIANYPSVDIKIGSMGKPFPGIHPEIIDENGKSVRPGTHGFLAVRPGWPAMMPIIWNNPEKYKSYFRNKWYITGDTAFKDKDGYFWFVGRADDVIKTSGERIGPFEVESALVEHPAVIEAGVIGKPDPEGIRGDIIKAFIVLKPGIKGDKKLEDELKEHVKKRLAGHAYPREFSFVESLPKTRSGKIMRRMLKAKELGLPLGDTSTLEED